MGKAHELKNRLDWLLAEIGQDSPAGEGPQALVRRWVSDYAQLLPKHKTQDPDAALRLLASWARLHRADKRLLAGLAREEPPVAVGLNELWSQWLDLGAGARAEEQGFQASKEDLASVATEAIRPLDWLRKVERADEEDVDDEATWAGLLDELDVMEVGHWAASRLLEGTGEGALTRTRRLLRLAHEGLREHAAAFIPARKWLLAFLGAVDYENGDEELVATVQNAIPVLEHVARFEKAERGELEASSVPDSRVSRLLMATALTAWRNRRLLEVLSRLREWQSGQSVAVAADVPLLADALDLSELRWASPDDRYRAYVDLPSTPATLKDPGKLPVRIAYALRMGRQVIPGKPAADFDGQIARLAGVAASVGPDGLIEFPAAEVQAALEADEPAVLEIGEGQNLQTWLPVLPRR